MMIRKMESFGWFGAAILMSIIGVVIGVVIIINWNMMMSLLGSHSGRLAFLIFSILFGFILWFIGDRSMKV